MNSPPLRAEGLHRFHRRGDSEVAALLDVSLCCGPGEMLAVVGPSGSGKSTLLSLLAGLDEPSGGRVLVYGAPLSHRSPARSAALRARHIGILTQHSALLGHLTVRDNVVLSAGLRARARRTPPDRHEVDVLLEALDLSVVRHSLPRQLSGGETARAGLAVALAGAPDILLADEPTAEVSTTEEATLLDQIRTLRPPRGATVLVTHSPAVSSAVDRVVHLRDGRVHTP